MVPHLGETEWSPDVLKVEPHPSVMRALTKEGRFERLERKTVEAVDRFGEITGIELPSSFREDVSGRGATKCLSPVHIRTEGRHRARSEAASPRIAVDTYARCRKCKPCLLARRNYWAAAALYQTQLTVAADRRTWFGTYTLTAYWQQEFRRRAAARYPYVAPAWDDLEADRRYRLICDEIYREVQKYWRRLRKKGHALKYLIVFEKHLGGGAHHGFPHLHALVHETDAKILKRQLQAEWPFGHTKITLVGGLSADAAAHDRAAWYVCKYLSKEAGEKLVASLNYRPTGQSHLAGKKTP